MKIQSSGHDPVVNSHGSAVVFFIVEYLISAASGNIFRFIHSCLFI